MGVLTAIREWHERRTTEASLSHSMRRMQLQGMKLANAKLQESLSFLDNYVDPQDAYDKGWIPLGGGGNSVWESQYPPPFTTQDEHDKIRAFQRRLYYENEFATGVIETRISYIVGTGHVYSVEPKDKDDELSEEEKAAAKEVIDEFIKVNKWQARQQESCRRCDRDGEAFLRKFIVPADKKPAVDGVEEKSHRVIKIRFVEPGDVRTPADKAQDPAATFGIQTEPDDVESVLGFYVNEQFIDAKDIQHRKRNVDGNVKRGLPLLYQSKYNLPRAEKVVRNAAATVEIQAAVGMVRKHAAAAQDAVQGFVSGKASATIQQRTPNGTVKTRNFQQFQPGTILDVPGTTEYEFPAMGLDPSKPAGTVQMILRAVGSRTGLPEFMVSADASNANYASTLVAEGPAVKAFQREQWTMIGEDEEIFDEVLRVAVEDGRLTQQLVDRIKICAEPPNVISRDELQGAQKNQILAMNGIKSPQTWSLEENLDYEREQANIAEHAEANEGAMTRAFGPMDIPQEEDSGDNPRMTKESFNPNQPRVPAGDKDGGQWTDLYHVARRKWDGGDLQTLQSLHNGEWSDKLEREILKRWPEVKDAWEYFSTEGGKIHFHDSLEKAKEFAAEFGGEILKVDARGLDVVIDKLEYPHPVVKGSVSADRVSRMKKRK